MERIEEKIRDKLAKDLSIFEGNLKLIEKESFLPNDLGTRGFVDILAKDNLGRFVMIELKRSKAASRETLHEILKYIEGIKENKSLKSDELSAVIVSTEWEELLIPFSSFVSEVSYSVTGYHLKVDDELNPLSASKVIPLLLNNERLLSDQHTIRLYTSKRNLNKGIKSHKDCFAKKQISDYVLLVLQAPPEFQEQNILATMQGLQDIASQFGTEPQLAMDDLRNKMPDFRYMVYSAVQILSNEKYWEILKGDPSTLEEVKEYSENWEEEELSASLHEYAIENCKPTPYQQHIEISCPAKLSTKLLEKEGWKIISVIRSGRLQDNELLTDEAIIGELKGEGGSNKQTYSKDFDSRNSKSFDQISKDVKKCLSDNDIWLTGILRAISDIKQLAGKLEFTGRIHIYNPSNTLLSIYQIVNSQHPVEAMRWVPTYYINIEGKKVKKSYLGCLVKNQNRKSLNEVIDRFYNGDVSGLLLTLTWGGYESRDPEISQSYGLEYSNFLCVIEGKKRSFFCFNGFGYHKTKKVDPFEEFFDFMNDEERFASEVHELFASRTITPGLIDLGSGGEPHLGP
jgi:hypothetical protein